MFRRSRSKVLVDSASEEEEEERRRAPEKEADGQEETGSPAVKDVKIKKVKLKKEKKDKKQLLSQDDEDLLLIGSAPLQSRGSGKKAKEEDKSKSYLEKGQCFWDSVTMTMKQITPTKKLDKIEGWEPPGISEMSDVLDQHMVRDSHVPDEDVPSWTGREEDLSTYASLSTPPLSGSCWTAKAKGKLAGIRRRSRGSGSENWEGLK